MDLREFLQRRIDSGESKSDIARRLGVHQSYITRWLSGMVPDTKACRQIADAYGIPIAAVLEMTGHVEAGELSASSLEGSAAVDPEWEVMQRELHAIYESWDRSRWYD